MKDRDASSFDLDHARELSRMLSALEGPDENAVEAVESTVTYVRFPSPTPVEDNTLPTAEVSPPPEVPSPPRDSLSPPGDISSFEDLLSWFMDLFKTDAAFVVDNQGFVIAHRGILPPDGLEGIGAEVYMAFEQASRIDSLAGRLLWVDLEFTRRRIAALRVQVSDKDPMLFTWINVSEAYYTHRTAIEETILKGVVQLS